MARNTGTADLQGDLIDPTPQLFYRSFGLFLALLAILALRAVAAPAPGISLYRPTADPLALLSIAAFISAVGLAAASMPAWRAARMDPLMALRRD